MESEPSLILLECSGSFESWNTKNETWELFVISK